MPAERFPDRRFEDCRCSDCGSLLARIEAQALTPGKMLELKCRKCNAVAYWVGGFAERSSS
jgi:phage FluMu protein Com